MHEFVVIAREDRQPDGTQGRYTLATRDVFHTEAGAHAYARTINSSREPIVVEGRWDQLRLPAFKHIDSRDPDYWQKRADEAQGEF